MARVVGTVGQMLRETGIALERLGCRLQGNYSFEDPLTRHREVLALPSHKPSIKAGCFIAPSAAVVGNVKLGAKSNVWYGAVVKASQHAVEIGEEAQIMEGAVVGSSSSKTMIGNKVMIGSGSVVGGATLGEGASVGVNCVVADGAVIEAGAAVAPGSAVSGDTTIPAGQLFAGAPAKYVRDLSSAETSAIAKAVADAGLLATPHSTACNKSFAEIEAEKKEYAWKTMKETIDTHHLLDEKPKSIW